MPPLRRLTAAVVPEAVLAAVLRRLYPLTEPELARLPSYAPRGGTFVDVGVWYGPWTRVMRRLADRVVAIEPNPVLAARLRRSFPGVTVVQAAASDAEGTADLWLPGGGQALAGVASLDPAAPALARHDGRRAERVRTVAIDDLGLADVRFVKIDVEGHESAALRGAERTIRRDAPLVVVELEQRHRDVAATVDVLTGWGYRPFVLPRDRWTPLAEFDLVAHQRAAAAVASTTFARRITPPRPRFVNLVLFVPRSAPDPA